MKKLYVYVGGRPGIDCHGRCEFCYLKRVKQMAPTGCSHCPPDRIGCNRCSNILPEYRGFRSFWVVAIETAIRLRLLQQSDRSDIQASIVGDDCSYYPKLLELVELIASFGVPVGISSTTGKGFDKPSMARSLIDRGLSAIGFSVFSVDPELRRKYVHDPNPECSLGALQQFCNEITTYASVVVLPGVNDGEDLEKTCAKLEEWGAKGLFLDRFGNYQEQGLIAGNGPIIKDQKIHTPEEFRNLVADLAGRHVMPINGVPFWDTQNGNPFAILNNPASLNALPHVERRATIITGKLAAPYLQNILSERGLRSHVVSTKQEIAGLITLQDLKELEPEKFENTVIIPGLALVHNKAVRELLCADGIDRKIIRGPDELTVDASLSMSMGMSQNEIIRTEIDGFSELINLINKHGT